MRHPLLRILLALVIGVVSPMCCCHAAAVAGAACGPIEAQAAETPAHSCCSACRGDAEDEPEPASPTPDDQPCPDCNSCDGNLAPVSPAPVVKHKAVSAP